HRVIQELLVDYYVKIQDTNVTSEDKKFHETLEQRLLVTELMRLLGPSQEREIPPLLGLEKADLLELMPLSEDFVWMRARLQQEVEEQLKKKCFTLLCYYDPNSGASPLPHFAAEASSRTPAEDSIRARPHQCPVPGSQVRCYDP
ncbi:HAUS augmin like complex subunit 4, partial [Homo sapiens]